MSGNFIIGLTGSFGAGSSTTTKLILALKEHNFVHFSLSKFIKDKARKEIMLLGLSWNGNYHHPFCK